MVISLTESLLARRVHEHNSRLQMGLSPSKFAGGKSSSLALACLRCSANGQCIPAQDSAKQEVFSSVKNLRVLGVDVGPAGIELSLEERGDRVIATFRDYAGSSNPIETTKPQGTLEESGSECKVSLVGRNRHGKVEIHGTIGLADFHGTVVRQVGKDTFSEKVTLRRKPVESDVRIAMLRE